MVRNFARWSIVVGIGMAGCGSEDSGDKDDPAEEAKENTLALINGTSLMGTWRDDCHDTDLFDRSVVTEYEFKGDDLARRYLVYENAKCSGDPIAVVNYSGETEIERVEGKDDYRKLNLKYKKVSVKLENEAAVEFFDSIDFCGFENWKKGEVHDLTKYSDRDSCPLPDATSNDYELVKIDDEGKKLYFGNPGPESVQEKKSRPEDVETDHPFVKQDRD